MPSLLQTTVLLVAWCCAVTAAPPVQPAEVASWIEASGGRYETNSAGEIVSVDLSGAWLTDSDLSRLALLSPLEHIDLSRTGVSDLGMERLAPLENVRALRLAYCHAIGDPAVSHIQHWKRLERLDLKGAKITSRVFEGLSRLTTLRKLDISHTEVDDDGFDLLASLTALEQLSIGGNRLSGVALTMLKLLPQLRHLDVSGIQRVDSGLWGLSLSDVNLERIATLSRLESLNLSGAILSDRGIDRPGHELATRKQIRNLGKLSRLKNLRAIDLSRLPLTPEDVTVLAAMPELRRVNLSMAPGISDGVTGVLEQLPQLEELYLSGAAVTDATLARLEEFGSLRKLTAGGTPVTAAAVEKFRRARPECEVSWYPLAPPSGEESPETQ